MNIGSGVEINPYIVSFNDSNTILRNHVDSIHVENAYSLPFTTGVSQVVKNIIEKINDKNLKSLSKDLDEYTKTIQDYDTKQKNLNKAKEVQKKSTRKKHEDQAIAAQQIFSDIQTVRQNKRTIIEKYLNYIIQEIVKCKTQKNKSEAWANWYSLYQAIKPEDFENDPNVGPPPADKVSTDDTPRIAAGKAPRRRADDSVNGAAGGAQNVTQKKTVVERPDTSPDDQDTTNLQEAPKKKSDHFFVVIHDKSHKSEEKESGVTHNHVDIMNHKDTGHEHRHYKHEFMTTKNEVKLWHSLFGFSKKVANESKYFVYRTLTKYLRKGRLNDFRILGCSAVALAENEGKPFTVQETIHQIVRSFLHMHDNQLQAIIWAYLRLYYGIITEQEAFSVLVFAVQTELKHNFNQNEPWDVGFLYQFTKKFSGRKNSVFMALHNGLKELENRVVFIEWIGDWKNFMKLHRCEYGPLKKIIEGCTKVTIYCPDVTITSKPFKCPYCTKLYPSLHLLRKHLILKILGTKEIPKFQVFKKTIEGKEEITAAPFAIEDLKLQVIHKGLLYEDKAQDERTNLFFITTDKHFRNCNLLDIEDRYRQRIRDAFFLQDEKKIYTGNIISVGIDKVECQRFIMDNFEQFKLSLKVIEILDKNLKQIETTKQELQKSIPLKKIEISTLQGNINRCEKILEKPKIDANTKKKKELEKNAHLEKLLQSQNQLKGLEDNLNNQEMNRKKILNNMVEAHDTTFNFYYVSENNESDNLIFEKREKSVLKLIVYWKEVTFLDNIWGVQTSKDKKEADILRYTLLIFAIFSLSKIKEFIESVLKKIQVTVQTQIDKGRKIDIQNSTEEDDFFVQNIAENIDQIFLKHGLIKMTPSPNSNFTQTFMSPFFSILLNNWLQCFKDDVGFHFKYLQEEFQVRNFLIEKIENEWNQMQQIYNDKGNSSTYKWHCDLSTKQLQSKEREALLEILKWKVFVFKANNCSMNSILQLTQRISNSETDQTIRSLIKNHSELWKKIMLLEEADVFKDEIRKDDEQTTSLYLSRIDEFEKANFGELMEADSTLDFCSSFFKNERMVDIQAKMFQCAKLLLHSTDNGEISHDNLLTIKWFEKLKKAPYQINIPSEVPMHIAGRNHIKRFRKNRDFRYNQEKLTYTTENFQTHFLTFDEEELDNQLILIVSFFTGFSAEELKSKIFEQRKSLSDRKKHNLVEKGFDIDAEDFEKYVKNETLGLDVDPEMVNLLIYLLANIVKRPIYLFEKVKDSDELSLTDKFYYHEDLIPIPVLGEPIHICTFYLNDQYDFAGLVVTKYSMNQKKDNMENLLYDTVSTWNNIYENPLHSEHKTHISLCKEYLYLIYSKITHNIPAQTILFLGKTLTGENLKKFRSIEKELNIVCEQFPMSLEEYETLISSSKYDLLEDCYKIFLKVKKQISDKPALRHGESTKVKDKLIEQVNSAYEEEIINQSGCRAVKTLDGGYDTGETSHTHGVQDATDDEDDWDDGYESSDDPDENEDDRDTRRNDRKLINDVERSQRREAHGNQGTQMVAFKDKKGNLKVRTENASEKAKRLNNEGKVTQLREGALKRASQLQQKRAAENASYDDDYD